MATDYIVSVDLGGTKVLAACMDSRGNITGKVKVSTDVKNGRSAMVKGLAEAVKKAVEESGINSEEVRAVCVGVPGSINPEKGTIGVAPNLNIKNFNIKRELEKHLPFPVLIENDVNLAALGIQKFELHGKGKNVLVVFIGTGIGGALIFDGKLYRGSGFVAGEIGHMRIRPDGPVCGCGKKGCLEANASRTAIVREIKKDLKKKPSVLTDIVPKGKPIKSKSLAAAVKMKDAVTIKHLNDACEMIGVSLANITNLLNLDMIVLGGGVTEALSKFMVPKIKAVFKKNVLHDAGSSVKIVATKLGDDAALFGGIALAEESGVLPEVQQ